VKLGVPVSVMLGFVTGPEEAGPARNAALFVWDSVTRLASGSLAEPTIETAAFSAPLAVAGAVIAGARLPVVIVNAVVAVEVPAGEFTSVAVQLIVKLPVCAAEGVPVSVMLGVKEGPLELEAVKNGALFVCDSVTFCASGSVAEPVTDTDTSVAPLAVAGAVITGFRFVFAIVIAVVADAVPAGEFTSVAVQFTVYDPACVKLGVPVSVMLGAATGPAEAGPVRKAALFV
jgi:hypothetical protein